MKDNLLILNFKAHKAPTFQEERGKDWILYGAEKEWKNCYGDFLIDLYNNSSTHNTIINGKTKYIVGQGWTIDDALPLQDKMSVSKFINNVGSESLKELTEKLTKDKKLFGGFAVQPIWSEDQSQIVELHHLPFQNIRKAVDGDRYFYTSDWKSRKPSENEDFEELVPFEWEYGTNQVIYYAEYRPGLEDYPLPDYQSGINYISADIDIATFVASNTSQGFTGGTLINLFNGEPTPEAARQIEAKFKKKFTGAENAGSILLNFSDPDKNGAEIVPLADNGQDDRYMNLRADVKEEIFTAHGSVNPVLFGVKAENGLGNNADEIRTASEHLQNVYVTPEQDFWEDFFNSILQFNGYKKCLKIIPLEPIKEQIPLDKAWEVMTTDEKREAVGLEPLRTQMSAESCSCKFSKDEELMFSALETLGFSDDEVEVVEVLNTEYNPFTFAVTELDKQILSLVNQGSSASEIAKATGLSVEEVNVRLTELKIEGLLDVEDGKLKTTEEAEQPAEELITVYKYALRPNAPSLLGESRSFCTRLMAIPRNYTREDINRMRNEFGTDVWKNRGGWLTNHVTGVKTPYCRHVWEARTVRVKRNG